VSNPKRQSWRTVDIVIASIIAVAFGVIFWAWNLLWNGPADAIPLPGRAVIYGMWLVPAVLGALIVRKPGAAFYTLTVASLVSVALGTSWGWTIAIQGPLEALGAQVVYALFAYR
jgi:energy-coupling factor transport system substrate-specific component